MQTEIESSRDDRFRRQADFVPRERLCDLTATVVGVGAIGRQVALYLAALGVPRLVLTDPDNVEPANVITQGYWEADVGRLKVDATADAIRRINGGITAETIADRYRPYHLTGDTVFCCVDSILARGAIWRSAGPQCQFWSDGRLLADVLRVLTATDDIGRDHYTATLFPPHRAQRGQCGSGGTIYAAAIAAGLMVHQLVRWVRGLTIDMDICVNLLSAELSLTRGPGGFAP